MGLVWSGGWAGQTGVTRRELWDPRDSHTWQPKALVPRVRGTFTVTEAGPPAAQSPWLCRPLPLGDTCFSGRDSPCFPKALPSGVIWDRRLAEHSDCIRESSASAAWTVPGTAPDAELCREVGGRKRRQSVKEADPVLLAPAVSQGTLGGPGQGLCAAFRRHQLPCFNFTCFFFSPLLFSEQE